MTTDTRNGELGRIRKELVVLALTERLWTLEPKDAALRDVLLAREAVLQA